MNFCAARPRICAADREEEIMKTSVEAVGTLQMTSNMNIFAIQEMKQQTWIVGGPQSRIDRLRNSNIDHSVPSNFEDFVR